MPITKASGQAVAPAAKGDLVVGSATNDAAVLAVGSADQVLTVDSSTTTGLKWATASAGGMTLISEQTASGVSSLSFSSIPGTYKQLVLTWQGIYHSSSSNKFSIRLNNDSGTNYSFIAQIVTNNLNASIEGSYNNCGANDPYAFGETVTSSTSLSQASKGTLIIDNYASTSKIKYYRLQAGYYYVGGGNNHIDLDGTYNSTSAITSIDIVRLSGTGTFSNITNTSIRLYGVS